MKIPFIESYLGDYDDGKEIKDIIKQETCNIIPCDKMDANTVLNDYDRIIISETDQLNKFIDEDKELYNTLLTQNKLFYIGNYEDFLKNMLSYTSNLRLGLDINFPLQRPLTDTFLMPNLLINVSLTKKDCFPINEMKFALNNLPSSVIQINIEVFAYLTYSSYTNLPNKVKIIHLNQYQTFKKQIKFPQSLKILVVTENKYEKICLKEKLKSLMNTKINHILMRQSVIFVTKTRNIDSFLTFDDFVIIKNNKKICLNSHFYEGPVNPYAISDNFHNYNKVNTDKYYITKRDDYKDLWNIVCNNISGHKILTKHHDKSRFDIVSENIENKDSAIDKITIHINDFYIKL